jgi:heptosyltransferase II
MAQASWDNVLVLQTSFLGDTVLTLPLIAEIRRRFPVKRLSVMCLPMAAELLQDHPAIDEIIVYDKRDADRGWFGVRRRAADLKARDFTTALTPHKSLRSAVLLRLAEIPYRVGLRQSAGWFFFHARGRRDSGRHDVERNLAVLEPFGVRAEDCRRALDLPVSPSVEAAVDRKFAELGIGRDEVLLGFNPGSVWPTKRWWPFGFARLIQMVKEKIDCRILLFGGAEDAQIVSEVEERSRIPVINLVGKINLRELPAALSRCRVFVTNDSGPMHVAVARGVPTVALFCATSPELGFYPYTGNAIVLEKKLICRPCASHGGRRCPLGTEDCIRQIRPETGLAAVERLLAADFARDADSGAAFRPEMIAV